MRIAIIGVGNVGSALASSTVRAGHDVSLSARHIDHAREVAEATEARAAKSNQEAIAGTDVVILAVPTDVREEVVEDMKNDLAGKAVIEVSNRPTPDPENRTGTSAAEELQAKFPQLKIVKAFNTAFAARQADPWVRGIALDGFVAGDDDRTKGLVLELVESIGFRPIGVGPLLFARTLGGMGWLNIARQMEGGDWQEGWKLLGPETE